MIGSKRKGSDRANFRCGILAGLFIRYSAAALDLFCLATAVIFAFHAA